MKKVMIIALILVGALLIPAVSAGELLNTTYAEPVYDETHQTTASTGTQSSSNRGNLFAIKIAPAQNYKGMNIRAVETTTRQAFTGISMPMAKSVDIYYTGTTPATSGGTWCGEGTYGVFSYQSVGNTYQKYYLQSDNWIMPSNASSGYAYFRFYPKDGNTTGFYAYVGAPYYDPAAKSPIGCFGYNGMGDTHLARSIHSLYVAAGWHNAITVTNDSYLYHISLNRNTYASRFHIESSSGVLYDNTNSNDLNLDYPITLGELNIGVYNSVTGTWHNATVDASTPITDEPPSTATIRTGTITMTDNNGTTITGFEVTAVNHYTGQSYTVSTETDIVVMSLPMDRTIKIRNPQTGVYEEAPIGYYRFYGESPGYKMLYEDGIQVSVMPEKYGSYQLCDIRVTSDSGPLSGKHQFQIRSRSDNSILQTGTISAKSATTGEWYNSTVSGGIASLILPYDTSNTQSQYAGNYYVYATSPGYKDSDYGTQIVVMPHTVSEIHNILLTPIGGVPPAGNVTLRIQVFSETGPGVRNAEIFIAGVLGEGSSLWDTYTASSTGYLTVSVPGNSTYDIVASGTGYYDSARRVQVFTEDPALIEIKLYLSGAPTVDPTTQPTGWVTPTPTQTTPPSQEDNLIGLSVKGLAKGFGIDYDTALLLFGLMIVFGAGGIVMNSVKGGAMEFIAGSIVGTFVAFALGLIPIWIFIIIAVVFGAYVLRVFVQGGQ